MTTPLTLLVCIVIALVRWKAHPKVSLIAAIAFIFLILHALVFSAAYLWIPRLLFGPEGEASRSFFRGLSLVSNGLFGISLATLLVAVFLGRAKSQ